MQNPFTPTFGIVPSFMAGRQKLIEDLLNAFDNGYGDPNLSTLVFGARGTGKTVLLSYLADQAGARGWVSANVTAAPGLLDEILDQTLLAAQSFLEPEEKRRLKGITLGQFVGVEWDNQPIRKGTWRTQMSAVLDQLESHQIGLLITVDEVNVSLDEMKQLVIAYQHFIRERRNVALLMAGLPHNISNLLADKDVSFLRRARQHRLGRLSENEVREALRTTIEESGRTIDPQALDRATEVVEGFPFMLQLVGYNIWAENPASPRISIDDAISGIERAQKELETSILQSTYRELSDGDLRFLQAMLEDEGDSRLADIAQRLGVKSNYASQYKRRLLEQGVLGERGRGYVGFELPMFREYLVERL